jgi:hypothetical protein
MSISPFPHRLVDSYLRSTRSTEETQMKVMVFVKATKGSEAGEMPSQELLTEMMAFNDQLVLSPTLFHQ